MAAFTFAVCADLQKGFEKPIPQVNQAIVDEFLRRASTRLMVILPGLKVAWEEDDTDPDSVLRTFVRDMVVDAAERKVRNPGGFSHENAGIFSVSRYEDFSKGRIDFNPEDLALLEGMLDTGKNHVFRGPIQTRIPHWNRPGMDRAPRRFRR